MIKLLLLPGFARVMYAIGRRGELWWAPDPSEFHFSFDCSIIVSEAAMFASSELALYAIRPAQSGEHRDSLQTILGTPEDNNLLSGRAIYAVMVTLAGESKSSGALPVLSSPYIFRIFLLVLCPLPSSSYGLCLSLFLLLSTQHSP